MKLAPAALFVLLLASCVPSKQREAASPSDLGSGEVLVIGRVRLSPPLRKNEQTLAGIVEDWRGSVMLLIGDQHRPIERPVKPSHYKGRLEAPAEREFSVALPRSSFAIRGGIVPLNLGDPPSDEAVLPGGFRVEIRPDDTAVYIGTIHYTRDEFWQIKDVTVEDDYERVDAQCHRRWGPGKPLRKALVAVPEGILKRP